jgi:putative spermidine/putrescine transport system substrate-binding protein
VSVSSYHPNRRGVLKLSGLGVASTLLIATLGLPKPLAAAEANSEVTVVSYGGNYQDAQNKALFEPFQKANPEIKVRQESPSSNAKLKAMVSTRKVTWDLVLVDDSFGHETDAEWLEPIDYNVIDKNQYLESYAGKYRVGADVEATVLAYRSDKLTGAQPNGLADFFDTKKFPGKRAVWKFAPGGVLEAALVADGVPPDKLYPLDVPRALKKLDTIKDDLIWWETGAQSQQLLTSGEAVMALVWVGRAVDAKTSAPIEISWSNWLTQNGWWVIPKGTKNKQAAMKALKAFTSADAQAEFTKYLPYGPTNKGALSKVDEKYKEYLPTSHLDTRIAVNSPWWAENTKKVEGAFQEWLLQ